MNVKNKPNWCKQITAKKKTRKFRQLMRKLWKINSQKKNNKQ